MAGAGAGAGPVEYTGRPLDDVLRGAAVVDEAAATPRVDVKQRRRHQAMRIIVGWISAHNSLHDQLDPSPRDFRRRVVHLDVDAGADHPVQK